jgi:hypothetical protein
MQPDSGEVLRGGEIIVGIASNRIVANDATLKNFNT